jgi:hypothetical protein
MYTTGKLKLDDLVLWKGNPRINTKDSNIIVALLKNQDNKLINLAKDICKNGLLESIAVLKINNNKYLVKEGNRRVAVLFILNNPEIIKNNVNNRIYTKFLELKEQLINNNIFENIPAKIYNQNEENQLDYYVEQRHLGENDGIGIVQWNSMQKIKWSNSKGKPQPLLDFFSYLTRNDILTQKEINGVTKTNWERILQSKDFKDYLGIYYQNNQYIPISLSNSFKRKLQILSDMLKDKTVKVVYDKEAQNKLISLIDEKLNNISTIGEVESVQDKKKSDEIINDNNNNNIEHKITQIDITKENETKLIERPKQLGIPNIRNYVIPDHFNYKTSSTKINQMMNELHSIKVDSCPIACSVLLRCFLEQLSKCYADKNNIEYDSNTALYSLISNCSTHLKNSGLISKEIHSNINSVVKNPNTSYVSILHGITHQTESYPSKDIILEIFNVLEEYCNKILTNINVMD